MVPILPFAADSFKSGGPAAWQLGLKCTLSFTDMNSILHIGVFQGAFARFDLSKP